MLLSGWFPIIPFLPHAHTDLGMFAKAEQNRDDTLNEFEHFWKNSGRIFSLDYLGWPMPEWS